MLAHKAEDEGIVTVEGIAGGMHTNFIWFYLNHLSDDIQGWSSTLQSWIKKQLTCVLGENRNFYQISFVKKKS